MTIVFRASAFLAIALFAGRSAIAAEDKSDSWFDGNKDMLIKLYEHFHTHPELSYKEFETSRRSRPWS